ncbi:hypothetical protein Sjap_025272 [Stephania japonica]|uniref:Uncharacterized protein n=1 Tax=Stephania japonica TaxID=461633 RepID=A0AAP0E1I3_9MAGN
MSLSLRKPIPYVSLLNVVVGKAFVNKSARLSLDRICLTSISPFFQAHAHKRILVKYVLFSSPFMNPSLNCAIHAALSSYNMVGESFMKAIHMILVYVQSCFSTKHIHDLLHELQVLRNDWKKWQP